MRGLIFLAGSVVGGLALAFVLVVVRPDQYVAHVLPLHGHEALADFFAGILIDAK